MPCKATHYTLNAAVDAQGVKLHINICKYTCASTAHSCIYKYIYILVHMWLIDTYYVRCLCAMVRLCEWVCAELS